MATFSGREAVWSGFRLIQARPGALLVWAAVYFVLVLLPYAALVALVAPDFAAVAAAGEGADPGLSTSQAIALQAKMSLFQMVQLVASFAAFALLYGAAFRAVLEPQESRLGYVRLGGQELWLGLVYAVATVLLIMLVVAAIVPIVLLGVVSALAAGQGQNPSVAGAILCAAGLAGVFGLILWLMARFSVAFPMSFTERKFLLFEAWPLTKGHAGKILLVFLGISVVVLAIELVLIAVLGLIGGVSFLLVHPNVEAFFQRPLTAWAPELAPWLLFGAVALSIVSAGAYAVMAAPLANIYRQLKTSNDPAVTAS